MQEQIPFFVFPDDYAKYEEREEYSEMLDRRLSDESELKNIMGKWDIPETPPFAASDMATR